MTQPELELPTESKTISVTLVDPESRRFVSPGMGNPRLFTRNFDAIQQRRIRNGSSRLQTHEDLSHAVVKDPSYGLSPVSTYRSLGKFEETYGFAVRPASGNGLSNLPRFAVRIFEFEAVLAHAEQNKGFISESDLEFLRRAFATVERRQTRVIPIINTEKPLTEWESLPAPQLVQIALVARDFTVVNTLYEILVQRCDNNPSDLMAIEALTHVKQRRNHLDPSSSQSE